MPNTRKKHIDTLMHLSDHIRPHEEYELLFDTPLVKAIEYVLDMLKSGVTVQECAEWEEIEDDWNMETIYKCSACKEEFVTIDGTPEDNLWNYCPNCGAKMMPQPPKGE